MASVKKGGRAVKISAEEGERGVRVELKGDRADQISERHRVCRPEVRGPLEEAIDLLGTVAYDKLHKAGGAGGWGRERERGNPRVKLRTPECEVGVAMDVGDEGERITLGDEHRAALHVTAVVGLGRTWSRF